MNSKTKRVALLFISYLFVSSAFAQSFRASQLVQDNSVEQIDGEVTAVVERLFDRYKPVRKEALACPLASKQYQDILTKITTVKGYFQKNCKGQIDEQLALLDQSSAGIQTALQSLGVKNANVATSVSGSDVATVMNTINDVFVNGNCSGEKASFLIQSADIVQSFAQMGLLVPGPNGIMIAGGGLAVSSILRILDTLFKNNFNFSKVADRDAFIRLSCSFHSLRQEMTVSGIMEVGTDRHEEDFGDLLSTLEFHEKRQKEIEQKLKFTLESFEKARLRYIETQMASVEDLQRMIVYFRQTLGEEDSELNELGKLKMINSLAIKSEELNELLNRYYFSTGRSEDVFDLLLRQSLAQLDYINSPDEIKALIGLSAADFKTSFWSQLKFGIDRISDELISSETQFGINWDSVKEDGVSRIDIIAAYQKQMQEQFKLNTQELARINIVKTKLEFALGERDFSAADDGTETVVNILSQYEEIVAKLFGPWGFRFVDYATQEGNKKINDFSKKFSNFRSQYLENIDNQFVYRELDELSELEVTYTCQDAMPFRRTYKFSNALTQQAYDFLETNKRLFHSYSRKGFLGVKSKFVLLRKHYESAVEALSYRRESSEIRPEFDSYGVKQKKYIGEVMLKVIEGQEKAKALQSIIEDYKCESVTI